MADRLTVIGELKVDKKPIEQVESATEQLKKEVEQTEKSVGKLGKKGKGTYKGMKKGTDGVTSATEQMNSEMMGALKTFASVAALKQGIQIFANFEDQMLRVKALTRATDEEYKRLTDDAKRLGASTAFSASQVASAQGNLAQSGFKVNEIMTATGSILSLASAANLDLGRSAEIVSKQIKIFNLEADQAGRVSDVLAEAQATSAADAEFLASSLNNAGAGARAMGFDLENVVALTAAIAPAFAEGSSAGTALNATFRDMAKNRKQLEALGVSVTNSDGSFRNLTDIITDYSKATEQMTAIQKKDTMAKIFGEEAQRGVNALIGQGVEDAKAYDKSLRDVSGVATATAQVMESGMGGSLRSLGSATEGLVISLITTLAPALTGIIEIATSLIGVATKLFNFINEHDWLQSLAAGLVTATIAVQTLTWAFNLLNISNPFGWIALGVTAITLLEKKFGFLSKSAKFIRGLFGGGDEAPKATKQIAEVPAFAKGTRNAPGGMSLVGENGPELVDLPKGSSVFTNSETKNIYNSSSKSNSNSKGSSISIGGDTFQITIVGAMKNGKELWDEIKSYADADRNRRFERKKAIYGGA